MAFRRLESYAVPIVCYHLKHQTRTGISYLRCSFAILSKDEIPQTKKDADSVQKMLERLQDCHG